MESKAQRTRGEGCASGGCDGNLGLRGQTRLRSHSAEGSAGRGVRGNEEAGELPPLAARLCPEGTHVMSTYIPFDSADPASPRYRPGSELLGRHIWMWLAEDILQPFSKTEELLAEPSGALPCTPRRAHTTACPRGAGGARPAGSATMGTVCPRSVGGRSGRTAGRAGCRPNAGT